MTLIKSVLVLGALAAFTGIAQAEESAAEGAAQTGRTVKNDVKKGVRGVQDATCETINGKMHCAGQKMKHKVQNGTDALGAKAKEAKEKAD
jgi:hypothetical protein